MIDFEKYWRRFLIKISDQQSYYDGIAFEKLVEELLTIMYGKKWKDTPRTHDGNKDFYLFTETEKLWAECKNYKEPIAMKTLAPTLVMAQVCDVDVILFFSRSYINKSAKEKIISYGGKTNKKIIFYDAKLLEQLIVKHNNELSTKFQLPLDSLKNNTPILEMLDVSEFFFPSAFSSMITTEESYKNYIHTRLLHYNEPFSLLLTLCNTSLYSRDIEIMFATENNDDKKSYEYLNKNIAVNQNIIAKRSLQPGECSSFLIDLRVSIFKPMISLPRFVVRVIDSGQEFPKWESKNIKVKCTWVGRTKLLGHHYIKIVDQVEEKLVENTKFSAFLVTGSSGTGKSRILKECCCSLLKYGYKILELNITQEHSTTNLIKEIIYFIYEVPAELIAEVLVARISGEKYNKWSNDMGLADKIVKMIISLDETSLDNFMKEYSEILFAKISKNRVAIIIDNIQFAPDCFQQFCRKYILYSVNQCRENNSILFTSVNSDYMTAETARTIYTLQNSNILYLVDESIAGFLDENQGILFLRELLQIKTDEYDLLFKDIIEAVSLNPFNLYQMVKLMEENNIIKNLPNKQGYVFTTEANWKTVWKIPRNINDILEQRLSFAEKEIGIKELYIILSACYLLNIIDEKKAQILNINITHLLFLSNRQILAHDSFGYSFSHDIIRKFFEEKYKEKRLVCLREIDFLDVRIQQYSIIYTILQICILKDTEYIIKFCHNRNWRNIPIRLRGLVLETLFDECLINKPSFPSTDAWLRALMWLCKCSRDIMGSFHALDYYNRTYDYIDNMFNEFSEICCSELRHILHSHCDIFIQTHQRDNAIEFAQKVLKKLTILPSTNINHTSPILQEYVDEFYVLKAIMYNRIFCAYNNKFPTIEINMKRNNAIKYSRGFISAIQNEHKKNLISYLNDSDEGYRYYGFFSERNKLMRTWNKCLEDIPNIAPEKTMNYYRKCTQCALIEQDEIKIKRSIEEGVNYLENGLYSHEPLIFNTFFEMAEVMCYLQHNPQEMYLYTEKLLNKLVKTQLLVCNNKMGDIYMLKGINAFYANDIPTVYYALKNAYEIYHKKKTTNYWFKRELIKENIITAFSALKISESRYNISFLPSECIKQLSKTRNTNFRAKGIIRTGDMLFNLPLIV